MLEVISDGNPGSHSMPCVQAEREIAAAIDHRQSRIIRPQIFIAFQLLQDWLWLHIPAHAVVAESQTQVDAFEFVPSLFGRKVIVVAKYHHITPLEARHAAVVNQGRRKRHIYMGQNWVMGVTVDTLAGTPWFFAHRHTLLITNLPSCKLALNGD